MTIWIPDGEHWINRRSELADNDYTRTPWEHDYGRVVHSAAFRRLQAKTQVFGVGENDFYRTRLTHSMEVSQIGEGITKRQYRELKQNKNRSDEEENQKKWLPHPVLMKTICLAHDLGHPPFGHGGEVALNRCMLGNGGFEGNGQALRIVTRLEKYSEEHGMDLTRRAVMGLIKYPACYEDTNTFEISQEESQNLSANPIFNAQKFKPPKCYLNEEQEIVKSWVSSELTDWEKVSEVIECEMDHNKTVHKSFDASIMEVADDIAYGVYDLEDCIALRKIKIKDFKRRLPKLLRNHLLQHTNTPEKDLFSGSYKRKKLIGKMVNYFIKSTKINVISGFEHPLFKYRVGLTSDAKKELDKLKDIVKVLVIEKPEVQHLEFKGQKIVTELFHAFKTDPERLLQPVDYERIGPNNENIDRVICDYIAGMTDEYAITRYKNLFEPRSGSIFDRL